MKKSFQLLTFLAFHLLTSILVFAHDCDLVYVKQIKEYRVPPHKIESFHLVDKMILYPEDIKTLYYSHQSLKLKYLKSIELTNGEFLPGSSVIKVEIKRHDGGETGGGG